LLGWLAWAAVHLEFLAQSSLRVSVFLQWVWTFLTGQRGSRLIVNHHGPVPARVAADFTGTTEAATTLKLP
jgi:NADH:ubiquinone reductase (H+-translocating)